MNARVLEYKWILVLDGVCAQGRRDAFYLCNGSTRSRKSSDRTWDPRSSIWNRSPNMYRGRDSWCGLYSDCQSEEAAGGRHQTTRKRSHSHAVTEHPQSGYVFWRVLSNIGAVWRPSRLLAANDSDRLGCRGTVDVRPLCGT